MGDIHCKVFRYITALPKKLTRLTFHNSLTEMLKEMTKKGALMNHEPF